ncbi:hypothetical protein KCU96_g32, partial [Aureobasidium melanogenum]
LKKFCPCGIYGWARFAKVEWKIRVHLSVYRVACIIEKEEVVELDCREFVRIPSQSDVQGGSTEICLKSRATPQATFDNARATLKDDFEIHDCRSFAGRLFSDSGVIRPTPASSSTSTESRRSRLYRGITFELLKPLTSVGGDRIIVVELYCALPLYGVGKLKVLV